MAIARNVLMEVKWADKVYNRATEVFLRKKREGVIFKYAGIVEVIRVGESKHLIIDVISFCLVFESVTAAQ